MSVAGDQEPADEPADEIADTNDPSTLADDAANGSASVRGNDNEEEQAGGTLGMAPPQSPPSSSDHGEMPQQDSPLQMSGVEATRADDDPPADDDDDSSNNNNNDADGDVDVDEMEEVVEDASLDDGITGHEDEEMEGVTMARGTDVNVRIAAATFQNFLLEFRPQGRNENSDDASETSTGEGMGADQPFYVAKLRSLLNKTTQSSLEVDAMHLYRHNVACKKFYQQLVSYPMEIIPLMDLVIQRELRKIASTSEQYRDLHPNEIPVPPIQVRPFNLKHVSNLRCLDPVSMDSLVCIKGMIVRCSPIIPDLKVAYFQCVICGDALQVSIDRGRVQEPHQCPGCKMKNAFQLSHNRCLFADKQLVRLQETPDQVPAGQTPASVVTFCFDDLVDTCQPGDKVEVTGVLRAQPIRVNPKISKLKSIYKTYIDVIHFRAVTGMERHESSSSTTLSDDRIAQLRSLSRRHDVYEQLANSLAPSIWGHDDVKKGVLCMLFGGNQSRVRSRPAAGGASGAGAEEDLGGDDDTDSPDAHASKDGKLNKRGDINILLCGDPGTSKSQLLSYVHKLSSRGVYTSGKGSSAVGLTASVVRDPETKDLVLESGALVLSDRGICCIDEFDKMSDATRSILHEAMEQQTVSIAKAGIIASLNARTSILASANPVESRYNPNLSVVENVKLPPTLLSRFDLIYLILDSPNADHDRHLAQHLVGLYYEMPRVADPEMDGELLRDYIAYARENARPSLSDAAADELLTSYLELRNPSTGTVTNNGTRTISATPRQLESLVRLSESLAKMRLSDVVRREDAKEALRLMKVATQAAATDPRTGKIDMDMIATGRSTVDRQSEEQLYDAVKELLKERRGSRLQVREIVRQISEVSDAEISQDDIISTLRRMDADGIVQFKERSQTIFIRPTIM